MIEFEVPPRVSFGELRDFIITELESGGGNRHSSDPLFHSLENVHVSKPIVPWRDPSKKRLAKIKAINQS
jgi:hypothetical protein